MKQREQREQGIGKKKDSFINISAMDTRRRRSRTRLPLQVIPLPPSTKVWLPVDLVRDMESDYFVRCLEGLMFGSSRVPQIMDQ